jgi:hypothetical protein
MQEQEFIGQYDQDVDLPEEEAQSEEEYQLELAERLSGFATKLTLLASKTVRDRSNIEQRWIEDLRQYHGKYTETEAAKLKAADTAEIFVNITRNKTNAAEARLQDMLFPTDDRSWAIKPTPVPSMSKPQPQQAPQQMEQQDPNQPQPQQPLEVSEEKRADAAAEAMQEEIDDQLLESRYQIKSRDCIHDSALLGTGIIKGPIVIGKSKKRWVTEEGVSQLVMDEALGAAAVRVNPWNYYPDMSAGCLEDAEFQFEQHRMTGRQLRSFAKIPGVIQEQVKKVYREGTGASIAHDRQDELRTITGVNTIGKDNRFEIWEYHGPISKSELLDAMEASGDINEDDMGELNDEVDAVVFFSGNHILKVSINPLDSEEQPYSVFNWEKDDSSIFGFGVPYLMRNPQKVINTSWRMMLDNAGQAVTDQIVINKELITPSDGKWTMGPKKTWFMNDKNRSVQEAFSVFETRSHQADYANIFQMARQLADEETNLPLIAQGTQSQGETKTSSGMSMLMNSANIVLRRAVKNWDDDITRPLINRFYDYNMQFTDKPEIKGDYCIEARGSSALLVREKQQESLMLFANLSASNPELMARRDWEGLDKEMAKALEVPYTNITLSDDQIKQNKDAANNQPGDPMLEFKKQEIELKGQEYQLKVQAHERQGQKDSLEMQLRQYEVEQKWVLEKEKAIDAKELKIAELQSREGTENQKIAAKLQGDLATKLCATPKPLKSTTQ